MVLSVMALSTQPGMQVMAPKSMKPPAGHLSADESMKLYTKHRMAAAVVAQPPASPTHTATYLRCSSGGETDKERGRRTHARTHAPVRQGVCVAAAVAVVPVLRGRLVLILHDRGGR